MPRLPSAIDVPTVSPRVATDPGLQAPAAAFESPLGVAAEELAPAAEAFEIEAERREKKLADAKLKQDNRNNAVDRSGKINQTTIEFNQERTRLEKKDDLSNQKTLEGYGSFMSQRIQEIITEHTDSGASPDSIATLTMRLDDVKSDAIGKASAISTTLGVAKGNETYDNRLVTIGENAAESITIKGLSQIIDSVDVALEDLKDVFGTSEEANQLQRGKEHAVLSRVDRLIIQDRAEEAESLLIDGDMNRFLSPEKQRETRRKIDNVFKSKKDAINQANTAFLVEQAVLRARREHINAVMQGIDVPQIQPGDNVVDPPAVLTPFAPEQGLEGEVIAPTEDAQAVARLFTQSRRLLLAGENELASGLLSEARFIIENSPAIQREKELDKPISDELSREFGVPVGTTLRSVLGAIPRSTEELSRTRAIGAARGKEQIKGEEQIAFIDEAGIIVDDLLDEIKVDPTIVGIGGSLRATGQTAIGVLGDLGARSLVESARELAFENTDLGLDDVTKMFDSPTLSTLGIMENSIGMILARLRTPSGRIPVDVIKRSIDDVKLTGLRGSKQVENRLNFIRQQLSRRASSIEQRFKLPSKNEIGIPRFRIEEGKLVPIQGGQ